MRHVKQRMHARHRQVRMVGTAGSSFSKSPANNTLYGRAPWIKELDPEPVSRARKLVTHIRVSDNGRPMGQPTQKVKIFSTPAPKHGFKIDIPQRLIDEINRLDELKLKTAL